MPRNTTPPSPRLLASRTLPPRRSSAAAARATVRAALPDQLDDDLGDTVVLLTCELVTNAIVHAHTPCQLRLSEPCAGTLRVEVHDDTTSAATMSVDPPSPASGSGRGLLLIDALAATWGTTTHPDGKTVWFDVHYS
jgi:serine/threonine-protein kinase RsbW